MKREINSKKMKKKIFINLGGINKILTYHIYKQLNNIMELKDFKFCLNKGMGILGKNIELYDNKNFLQKVKTIKNRYQLWRINYLINF